MKVRPAKPQFFKPILPGFKRALKIPKGFLKYLKGHEHEHAVLRRGSKKWLVKLNGQRLEEGWEKFAEEHDLRLGDLLIFRHEGEMEFEVTIFDSSHCDREYAEYLQDEEEAHTVKDPSKKFEIKDLRKNASFQPEGKKTNSDTERVSTPGKPKSNIISSCKAVPNVEAAKNLHLGHPHFICTMKPYYLSKCFLRVPSPFARQHGLRDRKCTIMIRDEQRSWTFTLYSCGIVTYIGGGWHDFCIANCLEEGDRVMFGIVANGEKPILKFYDLRDNASLRPQGKKTNSDTERVSPQGKPKSNIISSCKAVPNVEAAKDLHLGHPHFICTMKPYYLSKCFLHVPSAFARQHGLRDRKCAIMVRDEQRSWTFTLYSCGRFTFIGGGWREFCVANCLKGGDRVMFEIVANGEKPILKFHDLRGNASLQPEGKKIDLDGKSVSTQGLKIHTSKVTAPKAQVPASTSVDDANANTTLV
ncbi:PREDICTED: B3 domain-containing protein REM10-like isoform X2 [Nicotiana attenuata]|uniref:B3 domain-containing protein REM10-like isoform X2 n=1 Tax=Nicotiana attenuata TaxID=49451 RepID=UPI000904DD35|nr:PREDICTED: B3 domain-containing protein REM10-like isoform X2 [Nicotiana attenuata]